MDIRKAQDQFSKKHEQWEKKLKGALKRKATLDRISALLNQGLDNYEYNLGQGVTCYWYLPPIPSCIKDENLSLAIQEYLENRAHIEEKYL